MPRLRNVQTGVTVSCSDELAEVLGSEWQSADESDSKTPAKKSASSKSEK